MASIVIGAAASTPGSSTFVLQLGSAAGFGFFTAYAIRQIFKALMLIVGIFVAIIVALQAIGVGVPIPCENLTSASFILNNATIFNHLPVTIGFTLGFLYSLTGIERKVVRGSQETHLEKTSAREAKENRAEESKPSHLSNHDRQA